MRLTQHLKRYLITGLLIILPTVLTTVFIVRLFGFVDSLLKPYIYTYLGYAAPGLGFLIIFLLIFFTGMFTSNFLGRKLVSIWESALKKIPFIKNVFTLIREISHTVLGQDKDLFSEVVLFEYPRKGLYSIGFITHKTKGNALSNYLGREVVNIFLPTTPNPTSGLIIIVPAEEVISLKISVEDAMKFVMSAGALIPEEMARVASLQPAVAADASGKP